MSKYSFELKLRAVLDYLEGKDSFQIVASRFNVSLTPLKNWVAHYRKNGEAGLISNYTNYDIQFKMDVLNYMSEFGASLTQAAAVYNISSPSTILQWQRQVERLGVDALLPKKKGRPSMKKEIKKSVPVEGSYEALQAENERLRMEIAYLKKLRGLNSRKRKITEQDKAQIIYELRHEFKVIELVKIAGIPRSTYYYWVKQMDRPDKYKEMKELIKQIFEEHQGRYGYRRITLELRNKGYTINHKTVRRLMIELGLKCLVRMKKYRSYRGQVGKTAPNILERDFHASKPNEKWVTDVTEFHLHGEKLYLSPIMDLYNGEIIAYNIEHRPVFSLVSKMLDEAFDRLNEEDTPILHSDQGWHYQMNQYRSALKERGIIQSMSRKGNCLDNAVMENFFGLLKSELLYLKEFESMEHFKVELVNYIHYYNHKRIKAKLKGMSPVQYRTHAPVAA
ncbi:IS3 family transposase [Heyndrickxia vini]|uniref:IS3 family transposase n=1 Tax=Heyndrickxia vini TaxID=1476025 RepID=A0ABX7E2M5_9BACI|nr:IS3 family transposase [Heyndrickxia vini]QQZ09505.1 IS3 family transposase [Heyndrickxia vini]QQZ09596.1 IS3 family transposase [Heyndrickxia vini]